LTVLDIVGNSDVHRAHFDAGHTLVAPLCLSLDPQKGDGGCQLQGYGYGAEIFAEGPVIFKSISEDDISPSSPNIDSIPLIKQVRKRTGSLSSTSRESQEIFSG
jgi:hypothetical protein